MKKKVPEFPRSAVQLNGNYDEFAIKTQGKRTTFSLVERSKGRNMMTGEKSKQDPIESSKKVAGSFCGHAKKEKK